MSDRGERARVYARAVAILSRILTPIRRCDRDVRLRGKMGSEVALHTGRVLEPSQSVGRTHPLDRGKRSGKNSSIRIKVDRTQKKINLVLFWSLYIVKRSKIIFNE